MALTLDEDSTSTLSDEKLADVLALVSYRGTDNRPAWIGGYRPASDVAQLQGHANWAATHYDFYLNFVRDYVERLGTILDIGCGAGNNTAMLARYGESALGLDSDPLAVAFATKHNRGTGAAFIMMAFPEGADTKHKFDYIFSIETLEHINYDKQRAFLDAALGLLKSGGRMFITTPNEECAGGTHVGIWTKQWTEDMKKHLVTRIERYGYFNNLNSGAGFNAVASSHHALVLR